MTHRTSCSRRSPRRRSVSPRPCGARSSNATGCSTPTSASVRCHVTSPNGLRPARSPGARHRPGHRGRRRAEHRSDPRRTHQCRARRRCGHRHRAVRIRHAPRHERHARDRRQPVRDHHRHESHGRPVAIAGGCGDRHRQPAQQRPHRQGRRCPLHLRWPRRGDERRVDQGVLCPGRRWGAAVVRDRRGRRARRGPPTLRAARLVARTPRRHARGADPPRHRRRCGPSSRPAEAVLGRRRQRAQQGGRRRGPDQAQRALLQVDGVRLDRGQEAHRPVVGAADPRVRCWSGRLDRGRRREGSRDLHRPQGNADRGRQRR